MWAGNAVIAHDNVYNRWTAGAAALLFKDVGSCAAVIALALADDGLIARLGEAARERAAAAFQWRDVLVGLRARMSGARRAARDAAGGELQPGTPRWI